MVMQCCIPECREKYTRGGLSFLSFPKNSRRKEQWLKILRRADFEPKTQEKICSKHFTEDCFFKDKKGRKRLKDFAFPTIDIFPTQFLSTAIEKRIPDIYSKTEKEIEYTPYKVSRMLKSEKAVIFGTADSTESKEAMEILFGLEKSIRVIEVDAYDDGEYILDYMAQLTGERKVPHVFINGAYFGGICDIKELFEDGALEKILAMHKNNS